MTALLASKGQQLWMRPNVGLPAVQFHRPLAQFAAGWRKACFCGGSHFLSLDPDSHFGDVLMLADRSDLVLVETAQADAIFQCNHGSLVLHVRR